MRVNLKACTSTRTGFMVKAALDRDRYDTEIKVIDEELARLKLLRHDFHGDWNYTLKPRR